MFRGLYGKNELDALSTKYDKICIFGDFNSRTKDIQEYTVPDFDIFHEMQLDELYEELNRDINYFKQTCVHLKRNNDDNVANNYGYKMIDFLKANNMYILNGRTFGDLNGKATCKNVSAVDYFVCSPNLFENIVELCVDDFCCMYSDVHCPVSTTFSFNSNTSLACDMPIPQSTNKWENDKCNTFVENIDLEKVMYISNQLDVIVQSNSISSDNINLVVQEIGQLFQTSASASFSSRTYIRQKKDDVPNKHKMWFNNDCKTARSNFHRANFLYKLH